MDLQQQLGEWYPLLSHCFNTEWMKKLGRRLAAAENVVPEKDNWFRAFRLCPPSQLKVIIIGQDPYINGEADGLSFSSFGKLTPSLEIVFEEINRTHACKRFQTHLDDWAQQGVLLLNAVLTTRMGKSRFHQNWGWEFFTQEVLNAIRLHLDQPIVFLAWGRDAWNLIVSIQKGDYKVYPWKILKACHPQAQNYNPTNKFVGCNHFIEANLFLVEHGRSPIWWSNPEDLTIEGDYYANYVRQLIKQIPHVKADLLEKLRSNPTISFDRHPFDNGLGSQYTDDLPF
jgi:uracil-DNA glycosylase